MDKYCCFSDCNKEINNKIFTTRHSPNFTWDKPAPWDKPNFFFCCQEHKNSWITYINENDKKAIPSLACMDQSMNYNQFFERINWNDWLYKRYWFEYEVS